VASAATGGITKVNKGKVIRPPPPASELIAPANIAARKNKTWVTKKKPLSLPIVLSNP
jgi:hypothetical protein